MNKDLLIIILCLALIYVFYEINNLKKKIFVEGFDATSDATNTAISKAVKQIYLADVEAIRLLSNFAIQLSQGGTTVPGNVNISGNLGIGQILSSPGRLHITNSELLYVLPKDGVIIGKDWGGNGRLLVQGNIDGWSDLSVGGIINGNNDLNVEGSINGKKGLNISDDINGKKNLIINGQINCGSKGLIIADDHHGLSLGFDSAGNGIDGARKDGNNLEIKSWWGIGFKDMCFNKTNIWFDTRSGMINCQGINIVDGNGNVKKTINN